LGVVELTLALHASFDFRTDRLVWDTGHQVYAHKMLTGRYDEFQTLRAKGGLMGYPNPAESEFDLFMTGHAGSSVSTALGLRCDDGHDVARPLGIEQAVAAAQPHPPAERVNTPCASSKAGCSTPSGISRPCAAQSRCLSL
jgi:hypothetical protein